MHGCTHGCMHASMHASILISMHATIHACFRHALFMFFQTWFRHVSDTMWSCFRHDLDMFQTHVWHVLSMFMHCLDMFWQRFGNVLAVFWQSVGHVLGIIQTWSGHHVDIFGIQFLIILNIAFQHLQKNKNNEKQEQSMKRLIIQLARLQRRGVLGRLGPRSISPERRRIGASHKMSPFVRLSHGRVMGTGACVGSLKGSGGPR